MKPADMWVYTFFPSRVGGFVSFFSFIFSLTSAVWMVGGEKAGETHLHLPQARGGRDAAESLVLRGDHSGQATANGWWWGWRAARHATGRRQEVAGHC